MYPGDNNFLWLSSYFGDGLGMYNYKNDSLRQFTRHDGLLGNYILNIVSDKAGTLYLTTENGITKFTSGNFRSKANTIFKKPVSSDDQQTIFDPLTNSLIIGQDNSLLLIPVDSSLSITNSPLPLIDRVMVNNEQQFFEPGLKELKLSPEQKNISIDFTAIHFANADKINFAYRLTGVDNDWRMTEANRTAQYAILSPGTYTFTLKAADETGVWSQTHASFTFTIAQPWWQNIWYRVAVVLIFTGLIMWVVRKKNKINQT